MELHLQKLNGRLLRKYSEKVIISYDSDGAGQQATLRGLEILTNLGVDVRILQMDEEAKDPDEFVIKYGNAKFNSLVEQAISLVEFKVKMLKSNLNLDYINDKIKFLNEIAKLLSTVNNKIEQEVYIDKIAKEYRVSKEAIYAEVNKLNYANNKGTKVLERSTSITTKNSQKKNDNITKAIIEREELIISLLIDKPEDTYVKIKEKISAEDFKVEKNKKIIQKLYEELEKGNSNINAVIGYFSEDEEIISLITKVMSNDYEIKNNEKAITDLINTYEKEKLTHRRNHIIEKLKEKDIDKEILNNLEKELQEIIIKLTQIK